MRLGEESKKGRANEKREEKEGGEVPLKELLSPPPSPLVDFAAVPSVSLSLSFWFMDDVGLIPGEKGGASPVPSLPSWGIARLRHTERGRAALRGAPSRARVSKKEEKSLCM